MSLLDRHPALAGMSLDKVYATFRSESGFADCFEEVTEVFACDSSMSNVIIKKTYQDVNEEVYGDEPDCEVVNLNLEQARKLSHMLNNAIAFLDTMPKK